MGAFSAQVQSPQTTSGKGGSPSSLPDDSRVLKINPAQMDTSTNVDPNAPTPIGKGSSTNSATSGQPRMGQPNNYTNTIGGWDNASIQPQRFGGKGKGS
jgi:hypothetical protein